MATNHYLPGYPLTFWLFRYILVDSVCIAEMEAEPPTPPEPKYLTQINWTSNGASKGTQNIDFSTAMIGGQGLAVAPQQTPSNYSQNGTNRGNVRDYFREYLAKMHAQIGDLVEGYTEVNGVYNGTDADGDGKIDDEYGPVLPVVNVILTAENAMKTALETSVDAQGYSNAQNYVDAVDTQMTNFLTAVGITGDIKKTFDAYTAGNEYRRTLRTDTKAAALTEFQYALK